MLFAVLRFSSNRLSSAFLERLPSNVEHFRLHASICADSQMLLVQFECREQFSLLIGSFCRDEIGEWDNCWHESLTIHSESIEKLVEGEKSFVQVFEVLELRVMTEKNDRNTRGSKRRKKS